MQMLEKALGVRFFENLERVAAKRLATMDDATASSLPTQKCCVMAGERGRGKG